MATWVKDIVQALKNLGGQATEKNLHEEIRRIRMGSFPNSWKGIINHTLGDYSSDSNFFKGRDYFQKIDHGIWALRDYDATRQKAIPVRRRPQAISPIYQPTESMDEIANALRTIKQYREYEDPDSPSWKEYVAEFFHILGFSTIEKNPRMLTLATLGTNHTPKAVVGYIHSDENFNEILPGLTWESHILYAAFYYSVTWGVLTNGMQIKVINYAHGKAQKTTSWPDFDTVIREEKIDPFISLFKTFSIIKSNQSASAPVPQQGQPPDVSTRL